MVQGEKNVSRSIHEREMVFGLIWVIINSEDQISRWIKDCESFSIKEERALPNGEGRRRVYFTKMIIMASRNWNYRGRGTRNAWMHPRTHLQNKISDNVITVHIFLNLLIIYFYLK